MRKLFRLTTWWMFFESSALCVCVVILFVLFVCQFVLPYFSIQRARAPAVIIIIIAFFSSSTTVWLWFQPFSLTLDISRRIAGFLFFFSNRSIVEFANRSIRICCLFKYFIIVCDSVFATSLFVVGACAPDLMILK